MLNFWRQTLDSWLNERAIRAGAEFRDEALLVDFHREGAWITVKILARGVQWELRTHYLVGADGMFSRTRMKLRPRDFDRKRLGAAINYYFSGKANLDPNTLYMFYMREYAPLMFAWVYMKDDNWVIGTGSENDPLVYSERFLKYVKTKYCLHGKIVRKEGFASLPMDIYLGEGNALVIGDAAGLVDLYRGLGMDNAALSGRLASKAIVISQETGLPAIEAYTRLMERPVNRLESNAEKQRKLYSSDEMLERRLSTFNLLVGGLRLIIADKINKILPAERIIFLSQ
jgi:flavin-dependent dehydrogenase